jgi:tRNA A-37 threonylcarbamoyl transferase component Bud32
MSARDERGGVRLTRPALRLLVDASFEKRAREAGLDRGPGFDVLLGAGAPIDGGRSTHRRLDTERPTVRLRPCVRGGALSRVLRDRFLGPGRPFRELHRWQTLAARGVALPTPVLAVSRRRGLFWHSAFGSVDHDGALDGAAWLARAPSDRERRAACVALGRALRRLHDAGAVHGDLQIRNVLLERVTEGAGSGDTLRCLLIDLDATRIGSRVAPRDRVRELLRLDRSLEKEGFAALLDRRHRAIAFGSYCGDDRALRRAMLRWGRIERLAVWRHRLGWWLSRRARPARRRRPG